MSDSEESSSDDEYYGPALPPNFKSVTTTALAPEKNLRSIIGPCLPPKLIQEPQPSTKVESDTDVAKEKSCGYIGPALPPGLRAELEEAAEERRGINDNEGSSGSDSDDIIGPLPPDHPKAIAASSRATSNPTVSNKKPKKLQREEWMLIPPSNKPVTELGLGPRKFLQRHPEAPVKEGEDIDSDEEFERRTRADMDQKIIDDYDKQMEAMKDTVAGGKRKTDSLMEIHQRELKKKKEEIDEKKERRPFDRNTDLSVTGLSGDDKKKYIEKSRELDTRFKQGRQKFL